MATPLERLESEVLNLPEKERARLAQLILVSLDRDSFEDPNTVERSWVEEIERRITELRDGTIQTIPGETVFKEIEDLTR